MQADDSLILRDIHNGTAPPWWPPAPGWWWLAGVLLLVLAVVGGLWLRRRRRLQAAAQLFDQTLAAAQTPADELAALSDLLRRAARRHHPQADQLQGEDWLRLLDSGLEKRGRAKRASEQINATPVFAGSILVDGAYRRDVSAAEVTPLRDAARLQFLAWMGGWR